MFTNAEELPAKAPRTAKGQRSRAALMAAASDIFAEHGFANARVSDLAAATGMSNGAFYRYFTDKHDILLALLQDFAAEAYAVSRADWVPGDPVRSVLETTIQYLDVYAANAGLMRVQIEVAQTDSTVETIWSEARKAFFDRIARALRRGQAEGTVRPDLDPDLGASLLGGMAEHYAYLRFVLKRCEDLDVRYVSQQIADLWASGAFTIVPGPDARL